MKRQRHQRQWMTLLLVASLGYAVSTAAAGAASTTPPPPPPPPPQHQHNENDVKKEDVLVATEDAVPEKSESQPLPLVVVSSSQDNDDAVQQSREVDDNNENDEMETAIESSTDTTGAATVASLRAAFEQRVNATTTTTTANAVIPPPPPKPPTIVWNQDQPQDATSRQEEEDQKQHLSTKPDPPGAYRGPPPPPKQQQQARIPANQPHVPLPQQQQQPTQTQQQQQHYNQYGHNRPQARQQQHHWQSHQPHPQHSGQPPQSRWQNPQHHPQQLHSRQQPSRQPNRPRPTTTTVPAWKRLWQRIEGGLDSLADLEDAVAGRANQLYTATVKKTRQQPQRAAVEEEDDSDVEEAADVAQVAVMPELRLPPSVVAGQGQARQQRPPPRARLMQKQPQQQQQQQQQQPSLLERHEAMRQRQIQQQQQQQQQPIVVMGSSPSTAKRTTTTAGVSRPPIVASGGASSSNWQPPQQQLGTGGGGMPQHKEAGPTSPVSTTTTTSGMTHSFVPPADTKPAARAKPFQQQHQQPQQQHSKTGSARPSYRPTPVVDDDDEPNILQRLGGLVRVPSLRSLFRFRRGSSYQDYSATMDAWTSAEDEEDASAHSRKRRGFLGLWKRRNDNKKLTLNRKGASQTQPQPGAVTPTLRALMDRYQEQQESSHHTLLKPFEKRKCITIGRKRALLDMATLVFIFLALREFAHVDALAVGRTASTKVSEATVWILDKLITDGWFFHALAAAILSVVTNSLFLERASLFEAALIGHQVWKESRYGALFLRLVSSTMTKSSVVQQVGVTAQAQAIAVVESARLRTFVVGFLSFWVFMTLSFVQPMLQATATTMANIASLSEWRWPLPWKALGHGILDQMVQLFQFIQAEIRRDLQAVSQNPLGLAFEASLVVALLLVVQFPRWEMKRQNNSVSSTVNDEEEEEEVEGDTSVEGRIQRAGKVANLGASAATRLQLASTRSALEEALERWQKAEPSTVRRRKGDAKHALSFASYGILSGLLLAIPVVVYAYTARDTLDQNPLQRWDSLWNIAAVLVYTQSLLLSSIGRALDVSDANASIAKFLQRFSRAVKERTDTLTSPPTDLHLQTSVSPTAGITVRDLWASHTSRRAWAVKGVNLFCKSGEVVLVLADTGNGKSKLLTTIAEAILSPPKEAQSVTRVRSNVAVGGLDVSKWDPNLLRKRVGLMLNDARTISDFAQAFSGLTMEEILEPRSDGGGKILDPSHNPGSNERACMILALRMTGLYSTLMTRLPSKLATVVTGNEEDLHPSKLLPHYTLLSAAEWSKLLLARVLSQAVYDNENAASSNKHVEKSLLGSILLLDDVTVPCSEADEGRLIQQFQSSGAATVMTSNRWALGRWADRIIVLKDGAVVETGTHGELLGRGPHESIYAAKWSEMTAATTTQGG